MQKFKEFWDRILPFKGRLIGALLGLVYAILILTLGFWRSLLIAVMTGFGFYLGQKMDNRETLLDLWESLRRNRNG